MKKMHHMEASCHCLEEMRELGVHYEQITKSDYIIQKYLGSLGPQGINYLKAFNHALIKNHDCKQHYLTANSQHFDVKNVILHYWLEAIHTSITKLKIMDFNHQNPLKMHIC